MRKRTAKKPRKPAEFRLPAGLLERAIILLCSGDGEAVAAGRLREDWNLGEADARTALELAQAAIVRAAAFDRDKEVGRAYYRLVHLYHSADKADETRVALACQRELNALLGLYASSSGVGGALGSMQGEGMSGRLETAIRGYLLPLGLAGENVSLVEHVRIAAAKLLDLQAERRERV
jgi:hypothetical protein